METALCGIFALLFCILCCSLGQPTSNCSNVDEDMSICYKIYQPVVYTNQTQTWQQNCENIECFLQCMSDAIGDCYLNDKHFVYEMSVLIVGYRASCSHLDIKVASLVECIPYNITCLVERNATQIALSSIQLYNNGDYAAYKEEYCSYSQLQKGCISINNITENCSPDIADYYQNLLIVSSSYSQCGDEQSNEYFTRYNGSINCLNPYTLGTTVGPNETTTSSAVSSSSLPGVLKSSLSASSSTSSSVNPPSSSDSTLSSEASSTESTSPTVTFKSTSSVQETSTVASSVSTLSPVSAVSTGSSSSQSSEMTPVPSTAVTNSTTSPTSLVSEATSSASESTSTKDGSSTKLPTNAMNNSASNCTNVEEDLSICYKIYQPVVYANQSETWKQNCENIECFLQCMSDAIGDCDLNDKYLVYEMSVQIVSYRASCSNLDIQVASLVECFPYDITCLEETNATQFLISSIQLYNNGDYAAYKEEYCSYSQLQKECISINNITEHCTPDIADFYQNMLIVLSSFSQCGDEQSNEFFTRYNGSINCLSPYTLGTTVGTNETTTSSILSSTISSSSQPGVSESSLSVSSSTSSSASSSVASSTTSSSISFPWSSVLTTSQDPTESTSPTLDSTSPAQVTSTEASSVSSPSSLSAVSTGASSSQSSKMSSVSSTAVTYSTTSSTSLVSEATSLASISTSTKEGSTLPTDAMNNSASNCTNVEEDLSICYKIYQPVVYANLSETWKQNCENIECFLQCMSEAIGDCYLMDKFLGYDMSVLIVNYRASCSHFDIKVATLTECVPYNITCLEETNATEELWASIEFYNNGDYTAYKEAYCNYCELQKECISTDITGNCTASIANFYESILIVSSSFTQCGYKQNHEYFTTYNGPINCLNPYTLGTTVSMNETSTSSSVSFSTVEPSSPSGISNSSSSSPQSTTSSSGISSSPFESSSADALSSFSTAASLSPSSILHESSTTSVSIPSTSGETSSVSSSSSSSSAVTSAPQSSQSSMSLSDSSTQSTLFVTEATSMSSTEVASSVSTSKGASSTIPQDNTMGCSHSDILKGLAKCTMISMETLNTSSADQILSDFCDNVECNIECYINSVGECYKSDPFFTYDTEVFKVTSRAYCNNYTDTLSAFSNCRLEDVACLSSFAAIVTTEILPLYNTGQYAEYRQAYCSSLSTFRSCINLSTISSCNSELANLYRGIYLVSSSYSKCEEQNHPSFNTFGGDVTCGGGMYFSNKFVITVAIFVLLCAF